MVTPWIRALKKRNRDELSSKMAQLDSLFLTIYIFSCHRFSFLSVFLRISVAPVYKWFPLNESNESIIEYSNIEYSIVYFSPLAKQFKKK